MKTQFVSYRNRWTIVKDSFINLTSLLPIVTGSTVIKKSFVISLSERLFVREKNNSKTTNFLLVDSPVWNRGAGTQRREKIS